MYDVIWSFFFLTRGVFLLVLVIIGVTLCASLIDRVEWWSIDLNDQEINSTHRSNAKARRMTHAPYVGAELSVGFNVKGGTRVVVSISTRKSIVDNEKIVEQESRRVNDRHVAFETFRQVGLDTLEQFWFDSGFSCRFYSIFIFSWKTCANREILFLSASRINSIPLLT